MIGDREALWPNTLPERELDVVGIGESSVDTVCLTDAAPEFGDKQALVSIGAQPGGQVATAVLACARLGLRAGLIGSVGDDAGADIALAPLRRAGVDLRGVRVVDGAPTRRAVVLVSHETGERAVLGHRDSRLVLKPEQLDRAWIERARVLHLDASDPELSAWAAGVAREQGIPVVLDADQRWPRPEQLLSRVDFPVVSRRLAEELGGTGSVRDGLRFLIGHGSRLAVATLGELGALAGAGDRVYASPGFRVKVLDETGAGDGFHGGFLAALLTGLKVEEALRVANAVGALNCRALGAQGGLPTQTELQSFLRAHSPEPWRDPDAQVGR
jgi:sulfofructose kinase